MDGWMDGFFIYYLLHLLLCYGKDKDGTTGNPGHIIVYFLRQRVAWKSWEGLYLIST